MYSFEMAGSFILVGHGVLCFAVADFIRKVLLIKILIKFSKIGFIVYTILIICRIGIFLKVHSEVQGVEEEGVDQGFGSFLAAFVENKVGAIILTAILMCVFGFCFFVNYYTIRVAGQLQDFLKPANQPVIFSINDQRKQ